MNQKKKLSEEKKKAFQFSSFLFGFETSKLLTYIQNCKERARSPCNGLVRDGDLVHWYAYTYCFRTKLHYFYKKSPLTHNC